MKSIFKTFSYLLLTFLSFSNARAQKYYVAYNPTDCTNCVKSIEFYANPKESIYFFQEQYKVDSNNLKKRYLFDDQAKIVFSDSLFNKYAIDGFSAISNKDGSLKYSSKFFDKNVRENFDKLAGNEQSDTLTFKFPIAKASITKYEFENNGKVYFIDAFNNSIIHYNLLADTKINEIKVDENTLREAYKNFSLGDTSAFLYYKEGTAKFTREELSSIKDISLSQDTLYACLSNYYFYIGGKSKNDTFYSHFESIAAFKDGKCVATFVPFNIKDILIDTIHQILPTPEKIYKYEQDIFTTIDESRYHKGDDKYIVGKYSLKDKTLKEFSKLSQNNNFDYNYSTALFSDKYFVISKSNDLYNIETGIVKSLPYFTQEFLDGKIAPKSPNFINEYFKVDEKYFNILYYKVHPEFQCYYTKIEKKSSKIILNVLVPKSYYKTRLIISPYDSNKLLCFYDNNKIVSYRISK